jgi:hypothetical protein
MKRTVPRGKERKIAPGREVFAEIGQSNTFASVVGFAADSQLGLRSAHSYELYGNVIGATAVFRHFDHPPARFGQLMANHGALDLVVT